MSESPNTPPEPNTPLGVALKIALVGVYWFVWAVLVTLGLAVCQMGGFFLLYTLWALINEGIEQLPGALLWIFTCIFLPGWLLLVLSGALLLHRKRVFLWIDRWIG